MNPSPSVSATWSLEALDDYETAAKIMLAFAEGTGLMGRGPERRYLWTDAFGVCNFLALARRSGETRYSELALRLIDRVHHVLGRHRPDDTRVGWLSGLGERDGEAHPTQGGLRIGKRLPERASSAPFDERLEWDRDGQYFHYLTKWTHALRQTARATGQAVFETWSLELADRAHRAFTYDAGGGGARRMYWKMSVDLSRPLVRSTGQHNPLDGYLTCLELHADPSDPTAARLAPLIERAALDFASMIEPGSLATPDPLGVGALLADASRAAQLGGLGRLSDEALTSALLHAALLGLEHYVGEGDLRMGAEHRLAFRELGLAIGLKAIGRSWDETTVTGAASRAGRDALMELRRYTAVGAEIVAFWRAPEHRRTPTWTEHQDINDVMLATALAPDGFLLLSP